MLSIFLYHYSPIHQYWNYEIPPRPQSNYISKIEICEIRLHFLNIPPIRTAYTISPPFRLGNEKSSKAIVRRSYSSGIALVSSLATCLANVLSGIGVPRVFIQPVARGRPTSLHNIRLAT